MSKLLTVVTLGGLLGSCAATPSDGGQCHLDCSKRPVAGAEFVLEPMFTVDQSYACQGNKGDRISFQTAIPIEYRIYQNQAPFLGQGGAAGGGATGGGGTTGAGLALADPSTNVNLVPAGGVGFSPLVLATAMDTAKTNPEFLQKDASGNFIVNPSDYNGVATGSNEFCSDSCGVIKYEVWPICIVGITNQVTAGVSVGAVKATNTVTFTVSGNGG